MNELEKALLALGKDVLEKVEEVTDKGIADQKKTLFDTFFKKKVDWEQIKKLLGSHSNNRISFGFNVAGARFTVSLSYRNTMEEKEKENAA